MRSKISPQALSVLVLALTTLSQPGFCEVNFRVSNNYDIQLTDSGRKELSGIRAKLVSAPSDLLFESIESAAGTMILVGRPNEADATLIGLLEYPEVAEDEFRTFRPRVQCMGTLVPLAWDYCFDTSETYLQVPGLGLISVDHESIVVPTVKKMQDVIDASQLRSPNDDLIASTGINRIQYINRAGYYAVIGSTPSGEQFIFKLEPLLEAGIQTFAVSDWSCQ